MDKDFEFITEYKKSIKSIGEICKQNNIDYSNLSRNRTTAKNKRLVVNELKKQIMIFYNNIIIKEVIEDNVTKTDTL